MNFILLKVVQLIYKKCVILHTSGLTLNSCVIKRKSYWYNITTFPNLLNTKEVNKRNNCYVILLDFIFYMY